MQWTALGNATFSKFIPGFDNSVSLGDSTHRWTTVYAVNGTINTSDRNLKKDIKDTPLGLRFIKRLRPRIFRWRDTDDTQARESAESAFDPAALAAELKPWEQKIADAHGTDVSIAEAQRKIAEITERHLQPVREARKARRPGVRPHYGLIAQEVKEALDAEGVDAGFWQQSQDGLQSLSYQELIAPLIRAVQELSARVEELEGNR
jgi:hypothetical protein